MDHFRITQTAAGFHVEGFPDASKVIRISGPKGRRLSDLALHKSDLDFATHCLDAINKVQDDPAVLRQALWRSAVTHYMKCFGDPGVRFQLDAQDIYKGDADALLAFDYFKHLRNKHLLHDENAYAQGLPGAILNQRGRPYKIAKIVCLSAIAETLVQGNYSNLHLLVDIARKWVGRQFDELCDLLTAELEPLSYEDLDAREAMIYTVPALDELKVARNAP